LTNCRWKNDIWVNWSLSAGFNAGLNQREINLRWKNRTLISYSIWDSCQCTLCLAVLFQTVVLMYCTRVWFIWTFWLNKVKWSEGNLNLRNHTRSNVTKFCACCLWPWPSPSLAALRYVMYFRFCDDVMFTYSWLYGASCAFQSGEGVTAKTDTSISTKFWLNDIHLHVHQ